MCVFLCWCHGFLTSPILQLKYSVSLKKGKIMRNYTEVTEFILLGLTNDPKWQVVLFTFLLTNYVLSVTGNLIIIVLTHSDPHLQTPMYFFLQNFSVLEILFTSVCIPRFLVTIVTRDRTISFNGCVAQLFFFHFVWGDRILLSGCHVLRPLRGHLQASALHHHHEQQGLHPPCP